MQYIFDKCPFTEISGTFVLINSIGKKVFHYKFSHTTGIPQLVQ